MRASAIAVPSRVKGGRTEIGHASSLPFIVLLVGAVLILSATLALPATTLYVDDDAAGDPGPGDPNTSDPLEDGSLAHPFDRIQEALDLSVTGDLIQVAAGTYVEDLQVTTPMITIEGEGRGLTSIEGAFASHFSIGRVTMRNFTRPGGFSFNVIGATLEHMEIVGGGVSGRVSGSLGGGPFQFTDVGVTGGGFSFSSGRGVGISLNGVNAPGSGIFVSNSDGGLGLSIKDSIVSSLGIDSITGTSVAIERTTITAGASVRAFDRLGVIVRDSSFPAGGLKVEHGAVFYDPSTVEISNSYFEGTGITYIFHANGTDIFGQPAPWKLTLQENIFKEAVARLLVDRNHGGSPDNLFDMRVINNVFIGSSLRTHFQYFSNKLGFPTPPFEVLLARTTIYHNTFAGSPTGIDLIVDNHTPGTDQIDVDVRNNIVYGGTTGISVTGTDDLNLELTANDVGGNSVVDYAGDVTDQTGLNGNISADPLFVSPLQDDYRLLPGSPCIDTGITGSIPVPVDHDGAPRPLDGDGDGAAAPDMGAYELDPDEDGDGVPGDADQCPGTPGGAVVNPMNGCSLPQLVPCDGPRGSTAGWKNHGQFVSAVAHAIAEFVEAGLLTDEEGADLVATAAQSSCGK